MYGNAVVTAPLSAVIKVLGKYCLEKGVLISQNQTTLITTSEGADDGIPLSVGFFLACLLKEEHVRGVGAAADERRHASRLWTWGRRRRPRGWGGASAHQKVK